MYHITFPQDLHLIPVPVVHSSFNVALDDVFLTTGSVMVKRTVQEEMMKMGAT